jgi:hypothetical protein
MTRDSSIGGKHSQVSADSSSRVGSSGIAFHDTERWGLTSRFGMEMRLSPNPRVETVESLRSAARLSLRGPPVSQREADGFLQVPSQLLDGE